MKKFVFIFILISVYSSVVLAQSSKENVLIYFKENTAFTQLKVDKDGVIDLSALPDTLILFFPKQDTAKEFLNYSIQFNKADSAKFSLSFNCSGNYCIPLLLEDIWDNKLKLIFKGGELIGIGSRLINSSRRIVTTNKSGKPDYVQIIKSDSKSEKTDDIFAPLAPIPGSNQIRLNVDGVENIQQFYCSSFKSPDCNDIKQPGTVKKDAEITFSNAYSFRFNKPVAYKSKFDGNAVTPKYRIIFDSRVKDTTLRLTYLKYINHKGYEVYKIKKDIRPRAFKEMLFTVIGNKDSTYILDSNNVTNAYMDQESNFSGALAGLTSPSSSSTSTTGASAKASTTTQAGPSAVTGRKATSTDTAKEINSYDMTAKPLDKIAFLLRINIISESDYQTIKENEKLYSVFSEFADSYVSIYKQYLKGEEKNKGFERNLALKLKATDSLKAVVAKTRNARNIDQINGDIKKLKEMIAQIQNSLQVNNKSLDSLKTALACEEKSISTFEQSSLFLENLKNLGGALSVFNHDFKEIDFRQSEYDNALLVLKLNMGTVFGKIAPDSSKDLAKILVNIAVSTGGCAFYSDFKDQIILIQALYDIAIHKKPTYASFTSIMQVPNADNFGLSLHTKNSSVNIFQRTYMVSGGIKIDFSTGIFFNGLSSTDFILGKHKFLFAETKDTIITSNGNIDTIYTGKIKDTSGNLIQSNVNKFTYSVGFLAHFYTRSGSFVNLGLATGLSLSSNANSPINLMFGPTVMIGDGKSRISITSGIVFGQQKTLSSEAAPYKWNSNANPENSFYKSVYQVPVFYTGSNDIPTYYTWKTSWFIGISYNFASLKIGK